MANWIKYMLIIVVFVGATVLISYQTTRHHTNVAATQEVQVALQSTDLGNTRTLGINRLSKKALVTNLVLDIVEKHKKQGQNIKIDYAFIDQHGNITENENVIQDVQFKVSILDKNGKVVSNSTQRITLNQYIE